MDSQSLRVQGRLDDSDIVGGGCVVAGYGYNLKVFPFPNNQTYTVEVLVSVDETLERATTETRVEEHIKIFIARPFMEGGTSAHTDVLVAVSGEHQYAMSLAISFVGQPERYASVINYTVIRKPL